MAERRRLYRSEKDRVIAGVCGGLAEVLGVDVALMRLVWVAAALLGGGLVAYLILWLVLPTESRVGAAPGEVAREGVDEMRSIIEDFRRPA